MTTSRDAASPEQPSREPSARALPVRRGQVTVAPLSPEELRAARREAERRALLRRTGGAKSTQESSASIVPVAIDEATAISGTHESELHESGVHDSSCSSWRAKAARQAYLSTIPPAGPGDSSFRRTV